jgi:hypothetical protein
MSQMTFSDYWNQLTVAGRTHLAEKSGVDRRHLWALANQPRKPSALTLAKLNRADRKITLRMFFPEIWEKK